MLSSCSKSLATLPPPPKAISTPSFPKCPTSPKNLPPPFPNAPAISPTSNPARLHPQHRQHPQIPTPQNPNRQQIQAQLSTTEPKVGARYIVPKSHHSSAPQSSDEREHRGTAIPGWALRLPARLIRRALLPPQHGTRTASS